MRVGYDAKRVFFNKTGLGVYSRNIITSAITTPEVDSAFLYSPAVSKSSFANFFDNEKKVHLREPVSLFSRTFPSIWRSFSLAKECTFDKIDIYHGLSFELPHGIEKKNIKTIVTIHDLIFLIYPDLYKLIDRSVYAYKTRISSRICDAVITVSSKTKEDLCRYAGISPNKIHVVYQPCSDRYRIKLQQSIIDYVLTKYCIPAPYILFVSSITKRKNLMTLIKAFGIICDKTDAILVVVGHGKGKYFAEVRKKISDLNLQKRVIFAGHIDDNDMPALYQGAKVFTYPSFYEGFGLPVLEAITSGTPVLAATGSCLEEAGGEGAIYTNPNDEYEMADKLFSLLTDSTLRKTLIAKGGTHSSLFTTTTCRDALIKIYKSLHSSGN